jgi:pyrroline-5-carboxylate reductase
MKKLGFIGGGNMAEALLRGLINTRVFAPSDLIVSDVDVSRRRKLSRALNITAANDNREVLTQAAALLIAVKPQNIDAVLADLAQPLEPNTNRSGRKAPSGAAANGRLVISIAAGITLKRLTSALGPGARVIRVMPNAPAMVGQGMAAIVRSEGATRADENFALKIFRAVGDAVALSDESLLDGVTALSGSGPAYVYLFVKALADAGVNEGLPAELSMRMALKTLRGAEENMRRSKLDPAELIRIVASPGGTTEAALRKFAESGFSDIVADALHAAAERSRELGRT